MKLSQFFAKLMVRLFFILVLAAGEAYGKVVIS
jgi:hypothetical protein